MTPSDPNSPNGQTAAAPPIRAATDNGGAPAVGRAPIAPGAKLGDEQPADDRPTPRPGRLRRLAPLVVGALALTLVARAGIRWWHERQARLPAGIVYGNGRLEADDIDIDTKFAARVADLYANEGDFVRTGQAVARMDTRDLEAQRRTAQAQLRQALHTLDEDRATVAQLRSEVQLANQEVHWYQTLVQQDYVTQEAYDSLLTAAAATSETLGAAQARVQEAQSAVEAARHVVEFSNVNITDDSLVAPRDGRIQYRVSNVGEVLPAGGKVFTMLDAASVYMDIYLPTADAGRVRIGAASRIVLDAYPHTPIPAYVSFLGSEAQFTPKAVETQSDRDKLMFRVKVRVDTAVLRAYATAVRTGLPGVGYVRVDSTVPWPPQLQGHVPVQDPSPPKPAS